MGAVQSSFFAATATEEDMSDSSAFVKHRLAATLAAAALALASGAATAHDLTRLGKVEFKVDCNEAAQKEFSRAMALYHSFAWNAAAESFAAIAAADPSCGMAHWGRAMVMLDNPFVWPAGLTAEKFKNIAAALDAARAAGLKSERERGYVEAVAAFVKDAPAAPHAQRLAAFDAAMSALAARHPEDKEAAILSALITSANFNPADKTYANQLKAGRILEPLFRDNPNHPGVAHYIIHSYDYPPIARHGVEAAKLYASIAPDAPHALHMPSHIFTRLGYWRESIAANTASAAAAGTVVMDGHHAYDYMVYAHLQLAQDKAARAAMEKSYASQPVDHFAASFAYAAMPARFALERGQWAEAAALPLKPAADAYAWKKYPQAEAVNAFARGVGAARSGDAAAARAQQTRLAGLRDAAKELRLAYWAEQIDIQSGIVAALALCAEGKPADCVTALREAAAREDATEKHVVTPGPLLPARELLAETLLTQRLFAEALKEFETVLEKEPNRYRALAGAMAAAEGAGDAAKAKRFAAEVVKLGSDADEMRETLRQARKLAG
jgi:hypothetical protein